MKKFLLQLGIVLLGVFLWGLLWNLGNALVMSTWPEALRADGSLGSTPLLLGLFALSLLLSVGAGALAGRLAGPTQGNTVFVLAVVLMTIGVFMQSAFWALLPFWYHLLFLGGLIPATLAGGALGRTAGGRRTPGPETPSTG